MISELVSSIYRIFILIQSSFVGKTIIVYGIAYLFLDVIMTLSDD